MRRPGEAVRRTAFPRRTVLCAVINLPPPVDAPPLHHVRVRRLAARLKRVIRRVIRVAYQYGFRRLKMGKRVELVWQFRVFRITEEF